MMVTIVLESPNDSCEIRVFFYLEKLKKKKAKATLA